MRGGQYVPVEIEAKVAISVTVGFDHTCVLFASGDPECWGWGSLLQGTDGLAGGVHPTVGSMGGYKQAIVPPVPGPGEDRVKPPLYSQIVAGKTGTCGRTQAGDAICWGRNDYGQGAVPTHIMVGNIQRSVGKVLGISVRQTHTCAIRAEDRRGVCWGSNRYGECSYPHSGVYLPWDVLALKTISVGEV